MKYIITATKQAILFSEDLVHEDVMRKFGLEVHECLSAGYASLNKDGTLFCRGRSMSMGLASSAEDSGIVTNELTRF